MSIEKKSLISNRMASKKAIVTKPEVNNVAASKLIAHSRVSVPKVTVGKTHVSIPKTHVTVGKTHVSIPKTHVSVGKTHLSIARVSVPKIKI